MPMFYIVLLIVFGLLFLVAELVLLPGVSIGAVLSLVCYGSSIYLAYRDYGPVTGTLVVLVILVQVFQSAGTRAAVRLDRRVGDKARRKAARKRKAEKAGLQ